MYYPSQSPGVGHKLQNHHDQNSWARTHYGPQPGQPSVGPPPASPGYALYTNPAVSHMQHHPGSHPHAYPHQPTHHHQNSLGHYSSPQNGHAHAAHIGPGSPASVQQQPTETMPQHWQQQIFKYETVRASRSPHHRARASAMASRNVHKSAIPITNPNALPIVKPAEVEANGTNGTNGTNVAATNGTSKDGDTAQPAAPSSATASPNTPTLNAVAANHPSSTVAPIADVPRPAAPSAPRAPNIWTSLDMGGVNIKNIPPTSGVFTYTFLVTLYLNHNQLTSIPAQIGKLRNLELLDLSGNKLTALPPELGMITALKELYLFDNQLTDLPGEFGQLHQLQTLGIEGNPHFSSLLREIIQRDGTHSLISHLRDNCPAPEPPPPREWVPLITPAEREMIQNDPSVETFSVCCYNILCERAATEHLYGYTPAWALAWDYRKELILTEVMNLNADFLCLQEVDVAQYEEYFVPALSQEGCDYEGVFYPKGRHARKKTEADRRLVDGCATFFKKNKYTLVEQQLIEFQALAMQRADFKKTDDIFERILNRDHHAVVCLLESKETGTRFVLTNAHIFWDPHYADVKLVQTALMVEELEKVAERFAKYPPRPPVPGENGAPPKPAPTYSDGTKIPLIICSDLNSVPKSGVCEFMNNGHVPPTHPDFGPHLYGRYTSEGPRHKLGLKSSYAALDDFPLTNHTPGFDGIVDYIWYSTQNIAVNAVLGEVDKSYLEKVVGFPNAHFPSDHICIMAEFRVKPPRENQPTRPSSTFPKSSS